MKLGLRNIRKLMNYVGHPERRFESIHIAGTNGKGSTASYLASIAMEAGFKTGLYTSPHLLRFTERIKINGKELSEAELVYYIEALRPAIDASRATFFEAATAVAFLHFAEEDVDIAVVETGLGGRFDATNIVVPRVSVITNIAFDHTEYLGNTLPKIAREKGGIIKAGVPIVTGATAPEVLAVFEHIARKKKSRLYHADRLVRGEAVRGGRRDGAIRITSGFMRGERITPGLPGEHQIHNARLAIATVDLLRKRNPRNFRRLSKAAVKRGLEKVVRNTGLHGRLEKVHWHGACILDVAHNPAGARTLAESLETRGEKPAVAVFGVMKDKDFRTMLQALSGTVRKLVVVAPRTGRALPVSSLYRAAEKTGFEVKRGGSVAGGLRAARRMAGPTGTVLITGSHYVVAEALEQMQKRT